MTRQLKDPLHKELTVILEGMLDRDEEITARAVSRLHSTIRNASDITRHDERRAILERFKVKQIELRKFASKVRHSGTTKAAKVLQAADERIRDLEANEDARIQSHLQMINTVFELGGTAKLQKFYKEHARIRDLLARQGALPPELTGETTPAPSSTKRAMLGSRKM